MKLRRIRNVHEAGALGTDGTELNMLLHFNGSQIARRRGSLQPHAILALTASAKQGSGG